MPGSTYGGSHGPPVNRHPRWLRAGALVLTAVIFWADTLTPIGVAVPALYVVPILLFMMGGEYWDPVLVPLRTRLFSASTSSLRAAAPHWRITVRSISHGLEHASLSRTRRTLARWGCSPAEREAREQSWSRLGS